MCSPISREIFVQKRSEQSGKAFPAAFLFEVQTLSTDGTETQEVPAPSGGDGGGRSPCHLLVTGHNEVQ